MSACSSDAPADNTPLVRLHGAWLATAIAEHFHDRELKVLLLLDSLTRFAQAQRELALAIGEPPATKGYPPSVFARMPQLVERAGNSDRGAGSITAVLGTMSSMKLQNYRAFIDRLSDAIRQQAQAVQVAREDYERKREAWRERHVEANALGKAMARFKSEEELACARREQQQARRAVGGPAAQPRDRRRDRHVEDR